MNVKELKEKIENIPDNYLVVLPNHNEVTTFDLSNEYPVGAIILSDANICCMCGAKTDDDNSEDFYYQEDTDEYICQECYVMWLNKRINKNLNE